MNWKRTSETLAASLLKPIPPTIIVFVGVYTLLWGLWIASPFWEVFTKAQLYGLLAAVAPEMFWGLLAIGCAFVAIFGALRPSPKALKYAHLVSFWHWLMITIMYFMGDALSTGGISAAFFAVFSAYVWLNTKINSSNGHAISV